MADIHGLLVVIETARDNLRSLMNAYPDRFPRHAFQGTHDILDEALSWRNGDQPALPFDRLSSDK